MASDLRAETVSDGDIANERRHLRRYLGIEISALFSTRTTPPGSTLFAFAVSLQVLKTRITRMAQMKASHQIRVIRGKISQFCLMLLGA